MPEPPTAPPTTSPTWLRLVPFALLLVCGLFAYHGVWRCQYVFDDGPALVDNQPLLAGDWWNAAFGPRHQPLANRPLATWSLVMDVRLLGEGPLSHHVTNLALHLVNAWLLFALLRRTLRTPNLAGRFAAASATWLATAVAALWVVHPLGVDAVAYVTQRSTLLADGFLLLALLALVRAHAAARPNGWRLVTVLALAASMASKEDAIVGPLLLVLYERAFLLPSWASLRPRWRWYAALALPWFVLATCIALGPANATVGFSTYLPVTAWQWLLTQAGVVVHYLRQAAWPDDLRGAYDWGIVTNVADALLPGALLLVLLGASIVGWRRHPWWAWLGALFFLRLAPTSSVMPIVTEIVAERRAYLPMLLVLVPAVLGVARLGSRWLLAGVVTAAVVALALTTQRRVAVYETPVGFWADAWSKADPDSRTFVAGMILTNRGDSLLAQGQDAEGFACHDLAVQCENPTPNRITRYALSLLPRGRAAEALTKLRELAAVHPSNNVLAGLGMCLVAVHEAERGRPDDPRLAEAEAGLRRGLEVSPANGQYWNALAYVFRQRGDWAAAEAAYARVIVEGPRVTTPYLLRAEMLERLGRRAEIQPLLEQLLGHRPDDVALRLQLAETLLQTGNPEFAARVLREVLQLEPGNARATALLPQAERAPR